jgi:prophage tail gpP-like protein
VGLVVGGHVFDRWTDVDVDRDLRNIAGGFTMQYEDSGRIAQAVSPDLDTRPPFEIIKPGMAYTVLLDGEPVQMGWIDEVQLKDNADELEATVTGRDICGDLVDCAASPDGPVEWRGLNALQIAQGICKPFGLSVRAEVDVGAAFPVFGIQLDENCMPAIERACRQRGMLMVSDGVSGLILTVGGNTRAPAALVRGGNVQATDYTNSWTERFSDYYVKGQTSTAGQRAGQDAAMTPGTDPTTDPVAPPDDGVDTAEASTIVMTGHAIDPEVTRYRPNVRGVATQSGTASAQAQAEWALRVARGMGETLNYTVQDWRAGAANALWLANQVVAVSDAYLNINRDMLISGVKYRMSEAGIFTVLRVAGRTAFDRIDEPAKDRLLFKRAPRTFGPTRNG